MKKTFLIILTIFLFISAAFAEQTMLKVGVSIDKIPKGFYGTWRVTSKLLSTNSPDVFKEKSVDLWNLSRVGDVITLDNPFSGAKASITVNTVQGNVVRFRKAGNYDNKKLTDTVRMKLNKDSFTGYNDLKMDTISEVDGTVLRTQWATYDIQGEKISGESVK